MNKVLIIHNIPSPYRLPLFEKISHHVDLEVFFLEKKMNDRFWENELNQYQFKYSFSERGFQFKQLLINLDIVKKLRTHHYDCVIIVDDLPTILNTYLTKSATIFTKTKFVVWSGRFNNGTFQKKGGILSWILKIHNRFVYQIFADKILTYGVKTAAFLEDQGVKANKMIVGTQTYPESLVSVSIDRSEKEEKQKKSFITISYLNERKGIDILIEAFNRAFKFSDDYFLYIMGNGPKLSYLKGLAKDNQNIIFLGNLEKQAKYDYLNTCDVFVLPTLYDSWGLVLNEAMYLGKPLISTNMAMGAHELVKENGMVVESGNVQALCDAMEEVIHQDMEKLGDRSLEIIHEYSLEKITSNFINALT